MRTKQPETKREFRDWLIWAIAQINRVYADEYPDECDWEGVAAIAVEAGDIAARMGMAELHRRSREFAGIAEPQSVKTFLADCIAGCGNKEPQKAQYLDAQESADYLGITVGSLYGLVERRHLVPLRGPKRSYRFSPAMLDEYLCRQKSAN